MLLVTQYNMTLVSRSTVDGRSRVAGSLQVSHFSRI
jgi:hypothetical protein